jgi:hypothetical protein
MRKTECFDRLWRHTLPSTRRRVKPMNNIIILRYLQSPPYHNMNYHARNLLIIAVHLYVDRQLWIMRKQRMAQ